MYYKIRVATGEVLEGPIPLPRQVTGLNFEAIKDLNTAGINPLPPELVGMGYWPEEWERPSGYDPMAQKVSDEIQLTVNMTKRLVNLRPRLVNLTADEIQAKRSEACTSLGLGVTAWLDSVAAERQYDGIHALVGYVTSANAAWKAEAQAGIAWRDGVWSALPAIQAEIMDGTRPVPTLEALKAELPQIVWPV